METLNSQGNPPAAPAEENTACSSGDCQGPPVLHGPGPGRPRSMTGCPTPEGAFAVELPPGQVLWAHVAAMPGAGAVLDRLCLQSGWHRALQTPGSR